MKSELRGDITYIKLVKSFDNEVIWETLTAPLTLNNAWTFTKQNAKSVLNQLIDELNDKAETAEAFDDQGKLIGSGWSLKSVIKLAVDIFETKPVRGHSFIPTPEKYSYAKYGIISIHNEKYGSSISDKYAIIGDPIMRPIPHTHFISGTWDTGLIPGGGVHIPAT